MASKIASLVAVFILTLLIFFHPVIDWSQDLGRHIKLGQIILQSRTIPTTNLFSYSYPNFPFINHHWLSEVLFYVLNSLFGTSGLLLFMTLLPATGILLIFFFISKRTNYFVAFISTCLYLMLLTSRTYLRPELISDFFVAAFIVILYKNREKPTKWIFLLPFLELIWVNSHIYFPVGPVLIFLFLIDFLIQHFLKIKKLEFIWKLEIGNWKLLLALVLTMLATLLNPNSLTGALYPLHVFSNYGYAIEENQSLYFLMNYGIWHTWYSIFFLLVLFLFGTLFMYRKQTSLADWLISVIFTIAAFSAERNISLFVFATLIPFNLLISKLPIISFVYKLRNTKYVILTVATATVLLLSIQTNGFGLSITPSAEKGADFFLNHHLKGPIFNNFDIGSYLEYRFYPSSKVFVDGRPEAYPVSFFQNTYIPMQQDPKRFEQVDSVYNFQSIFFSYTDQTPWAKQFVVDIMQNPKWQLVYVDTFSAIWVKKDGVNKDTALTHQINQDTLALPNDSPRGEAGQLLTTKDYFHLIYFLDLVGWNQEALPILQKILQLDPTNCFALANLASNQTTSLLYQSQYLHNCQ